MPHRPGIQKYTVAESQNLGFGQAGSIFNDTASAISPPSGKVFIAITFLTDTTFNASAGMVAEDENLYPNTEAAAHNETVGSETLQQGGGGKQINASNVFPKGLTIYGRWTKLTTVTSGEYIAYYG